MYDDMVVTNYFHTLNVLYVTHIYLLIFRPEGFFDGVFLASDAEVSSFVDYVHRTTGHVS